MHAREIRGFAPEKPVTQYARLLAEATHDGRQCVVGAVICDSAGRIFVHRRAWDRALFPGCWDIVGGHVEPGEGLIGALAREVEEETGWTLAGVRELLIVMDWEVALDAGSDPGETASADTENSISSSMWAEI